MIPRIRPFFHKNYFTEINRFDSSIVRDVYKKNALNKIRKHYPEARFVDFFNYGRNSLTLALKILNLKKNDELLIPCFTCSTILESLKENDIFPVLYDVNFDFTIDINQLQKKITPNTKAILVTHYFGIPSNLTEVKELADLFSLFLIEDCAHTFCDRYQNSSIGSIGDLSFTSMGNDKPLSLGNGSVLFCNNSEFSSNYSDLIPRLPLNETDAEKCSFLSLLFFHIATEKRYYNQFIGVDAFSDYFINHRSESDMIFRYIENHDYIIEDFFKLTPKIKTGKFSGIVKKTCALFGKNFGIDRTIKPSPKLMNSFSLNLLTNVMDYIDDINFVRKNNGKTYNKYLNDNRVLYNPNLNQELPFLRYSVICKKPALTQKIVEELNVKGYECGNFNWSMSLKKLLNVSGEYPNSEFISKNIINLPCHPYVEETDILEICSILNKYQ